MEVARSGEPAAGVAHSSLGLVVVGDVEVETDPAAHFSTWPTFRFENVRRRAPSFRPAAPSGSGRLSTSLGTSRHAAPIPLSFSHRARRTNNGTETQLDRTRGLFTHVRASEGNSIINLNGTQARQLRCEVTEKKLPVGGVRAALGSRLRLLLPRRGKLHVEAEVHAARCTQQPHGVFLPSRRALNERALQLQEQDRS
jgi:hypothetical protein